MKEIILIKNGEIVLKGLNRPVFENALQRHIRYRLASFGDFCIRKGQSTIYIEPDDETFDFEGAVAALSTVFGISAFSRAAMAAKDMDDIMRIAGQYLADPLSAVKTFKVESKRSDKSFPLLSPEISAQVGGYLKDSFPHLVVDVHNPDLTVVVEVRDFATYIHAGQIAGAGGMPVGTGGRAVVLISGGIDSPVASYMMAKRGIALTAVHFASPPYTSLRAEKKVEELLRRVSLYSGRMNLFVVPFTEIQEQIDSQCPEQLSTVIMRRFMMRIAEQIARLETCGALITGESVGQVASQTIAALACTDAVCTMPVFRPLIGMDKEEIIAISRKIDTFETSIQPYDDCCTVFTPRRPRTNPPLSVVEKAEQALDIEALCQRAIDGVQRRLIG